MYNTCLTQIQQLLTLKAFHSGDLLKFGIFKLNFKFTIEPATYATLHWQLVCKTLPPYMTSPSPRPRKCYFLLTYGRVVQDLLIDVPIIENLFAN